MSIVEQFFEAVRNCPESAAKIAERAKVSRQQIYHLRENARMPRLDIAARVADAIGFDLLLKSRQPVRRKKSKQSATNRIDTRSQTD